jgi:hypothetical protein
MLLYFGVVCVYVYVRLEMKYLFWRDFHDIHTSVFFFFFQNYYHPQFRLFITHVMGQEKKK